MKKLFFFAAAMMTAMTINAQRLVFTEAITTDDFGATRTFTEGELSLAITNNNSKFFVDANGTKFGTADNYWTSTHRLRTGGKSDSNQAMKLTVPANGKLSIYARTAKDVEERTITFTAAGSAIFSHGFIDSEAVDNIYPIYTFDVTAGDIDITFDAAVNIYAIEFVAGETTGLESVTEASKAVKVIENGQIYILKNGVKYNVLGAQVAE